MNREDKRIYTGAALAVVALAGVMLLSSNAPADTSSDIDVSVNDQYYHPHIAKNGDYQFDKRTPASCAWQADTITKAGHKLAHGYTVDQVTQSLPISEGMTRSLFYRVVRDNERSEVVAQGVYKLCMEGK